MSKGSSGNKNKGGDEGTAAGSRRYVAVVLVLALVMIGVLGAISFLSEPRTASLADLDEFEGEEVVVKAVVVGVREYEHSTTLMLFQDGAVVYAQLEERAEVAKVGDRVRVRGNVYRSGSSYSLQVASRNSVEVLGTGEPPLLSPGDLGGHPDEFVKLEGVVSGVSKDSWGGGSAQVLGIPDMDSPGNWSRSCDVRFSIFPQDLNGTDRLVALGVVRQGEEGAYLYVYDDAAVHLEKDYWEPKCLPLGVLSEALADGAGELSSFPVNVTGYLRYEPSGWGVLTLADNATEGGFSLRVEAPDCGMEMHKGDMVQVRGVVDYDPEGFRYVLAAQDVSVMSAHGVWNLTLEELAADYYMFENAMVQVNGAEVEVLGGDAFLVSGNCSLRVVGGGTVYYEAVEGWLRFDEEGLFYYLETA